MRVITVRQPWAWAIFHGKTVENRSRNIAGDYRGPVAIHAAVREDTSARTHLEIVRLARDLYWTEPADLLTGRRDQFGHIIGVVDLVDAHRRTDSRTGEPRCELGGMCSPWAERDAWHLVLANPRPLREPIAFKGALGLRWLDADTIQRIEDRL